MTKLCFRGKISSIVLFLLSVIGNAHAQTNPSMGAGPWKYANPTPNGLSFTDMSFIDNNNGLAASSNGILKTTDGGRNWQFMTFKYVTSTNSVALGSFNDVHFITPTIAYAVGNNGLMIKTVDGGNNWTTITTPLTAMAKNINALHFINKDTGYIGGQALLSTTATTDPNAAPKIYFTRNGGATWDSLVSPFRAQQNNVTYSGFNTGEIHRIHFVNDSVGYASGSCGQAISTFSSIVWKITKNVITDYSLHRTKFGISATSGTAANHTPSTQTYKGCLGINDSLVLISSLNNNVLVRIRTGKNDSTANAVPAIYGAYEKGVYEILVWLNSTATPFPANLVGNVAGQMQQLKKGPGNKIFMTMGGAILNSTDNGTTWAYTKPHPSTVLYPHWQFSAMDVTPNGRIVIGSFNGLTYDSLPGSSGWSTVYQNIRPLFYSFTDMDWADYCNGILVGSNGVIFKTSDGGKTWINNSSTVFEAAQISLSSVQYHATDKMFFIAGPTLYRSPDQGTTNQALFTEPSGNASIGGFTMVGQDRAFIAAYRFSPAVQRTFIYRSTNASSGGVTWSSFSGFPEGTFAPQPRNIKFANQDTGYMSANRGKVYRTVDGGATWTDVSPDTTVNSNGTNNYTALSVVNGRTIFVGGASRKLFRSTDAGVTWTDLTLAIPATPSPLTSFTSIGGIIMNDANNGYAYSGNILLTTTNGWNTWTYDLSPASFSNMTLYPKLNLPITSKKLYQMTLTAGTPVNSTQSAMLLEYGNAAQYNMSTTEVVTGASCSQPNAGSIAITATGGITPYSYSINGGPYQSSNTFAGLTQGPKTISIKDAGCQVITKTINIAFNDNLVLTTNNDTVVCAGAPVQMLAGSNLASTTFSWSPSGGLTASNIANPVATVNSNTAYTVTASLNGCVRTKTVNIGIKPNPVINAGPDHTILAGDEALLEGSGSGSTAQSIAWTPATTILYGANSFQAKVKPATTTTYTLTIRDLNGCTSTDNAVVTVIPSCIDVKNAFSPNGDGMNDRWTVSTGGSCYTKVAVAVYNRYGTEVYKNDNYQNNWEGTYKGKPVADGTYYYVVNVKLINGRTVTVKGDITILR